MSVSIINKIETCIKGQKYKIFMKEISMRYLKIHNFYERNKHEIPKNTNADIETRQQQPNYREIMMRRKSTKKEKTG